MNGIMSLLKTLYLGNKKLLFVAVLVIALFVIVGCSSGYSNAPPPSGPIGGGC